MRASWIVVAALMTATAARAGNFEVEPTRVDLSTATHAEMVVVTNHGTDAMRFQVTVMAWQEDADGVATYTPTHDVEVFPSLFEVPAGTTKNVRVGTRKTSGAVERAYRVFVEELPRVRGNEPGVQVLTRMAIPVFIAPEKQFGGLEVAIDGDAVVVGNPGTSHVRATKVRVRNTAFATAITGWYVLAGARRRFPMGTALPCGALTADVELEDGTLVSRALTTSCK